MRLQDLVIIALKVSLVQGRLALKSMPAFAMYQLATDLFQLEGIQLPKAEVEVLAELARRRNLLAHGVWFLDGNTYILRDLTGTSSLDGEKVKRKVKPAGIPVTPESIRDLSVSIQQATQDTAR